MLARILVAFVANDGLYDVGEIRQIPDGVDWVAAGLAEAVVDASIPAERETARDVVAEGRETAVAGKKKTR